MRSDNHPPRLSYHRDDVFRFDDTFSGVSKCEQSACCSGVTLSLTWRVGALRSISERVDIFPSVRPLRVANARRDPCISGRLSRPPLHVTPRKSCDHRNTESECRLQTPHHVSVDNFVADKALFLLTACLDDGDKQLHCALCGTRIKWEVAFIAAHRVAEECVGTGSIVQVDIPYCPKCEETPYVRGCLHVRDGQDVAAQLAA